MTLQQAFTEIHNAGIKVYPEYQNRSIGNYKEFNWYLVVEGKDFKIKYEKSLKFGRGLSSDDYEEALHKTIFHFAKKIKE